MIVQSLENHKKSIQVTFQLFQCLQNSPQCSFSLGSPEQDSGCQVVRDKLAGSSWSGASPNSTLPLKEEDGHMEHDFCVSWLLSDGFLCFCSWHRCWVQVMGPRLSFHALHKAASSRGLVLLCRSLWDWRSQTPLVYLCMLWPVP